MPRVPQDSQLNALPIPTHKSATTMQLFSLCGAVGRGLGVGRILGVGVGLGVGVAVAVGVGVGVIEGD
jgi:hypothetical protein